MNREEYRTSLPDQIKRERERERHLTWREEPKTLRKNTDVSMAPDTASLAPFTEEIFS